MSPLDIASAEAVDGAFERFLAPEPEAPTAPGVAYGVVIDGELVHTGGLGALRVGEEHSPDADTRFRIASMSKSFIAAAVLELRAEGLLRLDDAAADHVPELRGLRGPTQDSGPIRLRDLLAMSSGLPEDDPWADRLEDLPEDAFSELLRAPKRFAWAPGQAFEYSNLGYTILGRVISNASGTPFRDYVDRTLLAPLGMDATVWSAFDVPEAQRADGYHHVDGHWELQPLQEPGAFSALGGLWSTVRDLSAWVAGYCDAWPARDAAGRPHPLSRADRREQQRVMTMQPPSLWCDPSGRLRVQSSGYCLGLQLDEDPSVGPIVGHAGGYPGYGSFMCWHPLTRIGVIGLANGRYAAPWAAAKEALMLLVQRAAQPRRPTAGRAFAAARADAERLLACWDDDVAAACLAPSVALDDPLERRRAELERLRAAHGALREDGAPELDAPLRGRWWLAGDRGSVGVEVMLTPEDPPRIQSLKLTSVPEPGTAVLQAAAAVAAAITGAATRPAEALDASVAVSSAAAHLVRDCATLLGGCSLGRAVGGDGAETAVFRLIGERGEGDLTVTLDAATGALVRLSVEPVAPPVLAC